MLVAALQCQQRNEEHCLGDFCAVTEYTASSNCILSSQASKELHSVSDNADADDTHTETNLSKLLCHVLLMAATYSRKCASPKGLCSCKG